MDGAVSERARLPVAERGDRALWRRLATGPVSWGVDFADSPGNPPWQEVLDGVAAAGYAGTELGPAGYLPGDAAALDGRGLVLTGGFVFEPLHDPGRRSAVVEQARLVARRVRALGGLYLNAIAAVTPERAATAGRSNEAPRLPARDRGALLATLAAVAAAAAEEGVRPLVHPHAGSHIEFADEIEAALEVCDLCLDTGHCAYAGIDAVALVERATGRIGCVHLKDLDPARVRPGFWASVAAGAFVPLGSGAVDLGGVLGALARTGYDGWLVVEQDRRPGAGDPVGDLVASRRFLRELWP